MFFERRCYLIFLFFCECNGNICSVISPNLKFSLPNIGFQNTAGYIYIILICVFGK